MRKAEAEAELSVPAAVRPWPSAGLLALPALVGRLLVAAPLSRRAGAHPCAPQCADAGPAVVGGLRSAVPCPPRPARPASLPSRLRAPSGLPRLRPFAVTFTPCRLYLRARPAWVRPPATPARARAGALAPQPGPEDEAHRPAAAPWSRLEAAARGATCRGRRRPRASRVPRCSGRRLRPPCRACLPRSRPEQRLDRARGGG